VIRSNLPEDVNESHRFRSALLDLMYEVSRCAERIGRIFTIEEDPDALKVIARYFGLIGQEDQDEVAALKDTLKAISQIRFAVRWDPAAVCRLGYVPGEQGG
jgi:hypothetical protein